MLGDQLMLAETFLHLPKDWIHLEQLLSFLSLKPHSLSQKGRLRKKYNHTWMDPFTDVSQTHSNSKGYRCKLISVSRVHSFSLMIYYPSKELSSTFPISHLSYEKTKGHTNFCTTLGYQVITDFSPCILNFYAFSPINLPFVH